MTDDKFPSLVVDEQLLFVALSTLAEIEDREQPFELLNVIHEYASQDDVANRFTRAVGRAITAEDREAIDYYVEPASRPPGRHRSSAATHAHRNAP